MRGSTPRATSSESCYMSYTLSDNRYWLVSSAVLTVVDWHAERKAAKAMISHAVQANNDSEATITMGTDKGYDDREFIDSLTDMNVIPHVAQNNSGRRSAVPDEIANTEGYSISQQKRKLIEQSFGWAKTIGNMRQVMVRGLEKVDQMFVLTIVAFNLTRIRSLGQLRP